MKSKYGQCLLIKSCLIANTRSRWGFVSENLPLFNYRNMSLTVCVFKQTLDNCILCLVQVMRVKMCRTVWKSQPRPTTFVRDTPTTIYHRLQCHVYYITVSSIIHTFNSMFYLVPLSS